MIMFDEELQTTNTPTAYFTLQCCVMEKHNVPLQTELWLDVTTQNKWCGALNLCDLCQADDNIRKSITS